MQLHVSLFVCTVFVSIQDKYYQEKIRDLDCSVHIYHFAEIDSQPTRVNRFLASKLSLKL